MNLTEKTLPELREMLPGIEVNISEAERQGRKAKFRLVGLRKMKEDVLRTITDKENDNRSII